MKICECDCADSSHDGESGCRNCLHCWRFVQRLPRAIQHDTGHIYLLECEECGTYREYSRGSSRGSMTAICHRCASIHTLTEQEEWAAREPQRLDDRLAELRGEAAQPASGERMKVGAAWVPRREARG